MLQKSLNIDCLISRSRISDLWYCVAGGIYKAWNWGSCASLALFVFIITWSCSVIMNRHFDGIWLVLHGNCFKLVIDGHRALRPFLFSLQFILSLAISLRIQLKFARVQWLSKIFQSRFNTSSKRFRFSFFLKGQLVQRLTSILKFSPNSDKSRTVSESIRTLLRH